MTSLPVALAKSRHKAKRGGSWVARVRVGATTRDASREEEERLYQGSGSLRYGVKPVIGSTPGALDRRRLGDYFGRVLRGTPPTTDDGDSWASLLRNVDLLTGS